MPSHRQKGSTNIVNVIINRSIVNMYTYIISPNGASYCRGNENIPAIEFESKYPTEIEELRLKGKLIGKGNL